MTRLRESIQTKLIIKICMNKRDVISLHFSKSNLNKEKKKRTQEIRKKNRNNFIIANIWNMNKIIFYCIINQPVEMTDEMHFKT